MKRGIMTSTMKKKATWIGLATVFIISGLIATYLLKGTSRQPESAPSGLTDVFPESFAFFDVDTNSRLTDELRRKLRKVLGSDAISYRTTIDMEIHYKGFLEEEFEPFYQLNRNLNPQSGERKEHNTIQLTYRYPPVTSNFFKHVKILFSRYNYRPILIEIISKKEGEYLLDNLIEKYGTPEEIKPKKEKGSVFLWKQSNDFLIVSLKNDRHGVPSYHIKIYYMNNLNAMIHREKQEKKEQQRHFEQTDKSIFN